MCSQKFSKEIQCATADSREATTSAPEDLLSAKSKQLYLNAYKSFKKWKLDNKEVSSSESVLLKYFTELAKKYKSTSLWTQYSMLKSTLNLEENIDISNYNKLTAFLRSESDGYIPKQASTFTPDNIKQFLSNAPDAKYLPTKVALIMGIIGACRSNEMYMMKIEDITEFGGQMLVNIPSTKTRKARQFVLKGNYYHILKKYMGSRKEGTYVLLFHQYKNNKISKQRIGLHTFAQMGKYIALFLNLPNPENYSGHSFRRSSATLLVDAEGAITCLKRPGGWKSAAVAEGYIDNSKKHKGDTEERIANAISYGDTSPVNESPETLHKVTLGQIINVDCNTTNQSPLSFNNCASVNITINIIYK